MLCDICKKREATIHIKEVKNGKCISTNLCPECAKEKELSGGLGAFGFNLAEVIFNVGKMSEADKNAAPSENKEKKEAGENAVQDLLKNRPEINAGNGDSDKDTPSMELAKRAVAQRKASVGNTSFNNIISNYTH